MKGFYRPSSKLTEEERKILSKITFEGKPISSLEDIIIEIVASGLSEDGSMKKWVDAKIGKTPEEIASIVILSMAINAGVDRFMNIVQGLFSAVESKTDKTQYGRRINDMGKDSSVTSEGHRPIFSGATAKELGLWLEGEYFGKPLDNKSLPDLENIATELKMKLVGTMTEDVIHVAHFGVELNGAITDMSLKIEEIIAKIAILYRFATKMPNLLIVKLDAGNPNDPNNKSWIIKRYIKNGKSLVDYQMAVAYTAIDLHLYLFFDKLFQYVMGQTAVTLFAAYKSKAFSAVGLRKAMTIIHSSAARESWKEVERGKLYRKAYDVQFNLIGLKSTSAKINEWSDFYQKRIDILAQIIAASGSLSRTAAPRDFLDALSSSMEKMFSMSNANAILKELL